MGKFVIVAAIIVLFSFLGIKGLKIYPINIYIFAFVVKSNGLNLYIYTVSFVALQIFCFRMKLLFMRTLEIL